MSDDESYEYDDDDGDDAQDDFDYTDDEQDPEDGHVALENAYYNAKGLREEDLNEAIESFESVIRQQRQLEEDGKKCGEWSFKALKQLVKLHLRSGNATEMMRQYRRLLDRIAEGDVSPNAVEKGINGMLERVSSIYHQSGSANRGNVTSSQPSQPSQQQQQRLEPHELASAVYDATLNTFQPSTGAYPNERLWFKTNLKYGQLLYEMHETAKLQQVLRDLKAIQSSNESASGGGTSTQSMEVFALQIQLYSRQKDNKKLREVFNKAMAVRGGIPHPRTLALIQELGGKMHMASKEYENAGMAFFQAFKSYDEAGDPSRLRCLKYLVLASMLHASKINPFDSQEARPYRDDPQITAMTNLVQAFQNNEIHRFERILKQNTGRIMDDEFIREHIEDLLRTIRTQVLRRVIRPYTRISLAALSRELNDIPVHDVENLLVRLILDGTLEGQIDQINGVLLKRAEKGPLPLSDGGVSPDADDLIKKQHEVMYQLINSLDEIAMNVTSARMKEGSALRGMVKQH